jgi:2-succinyl-5-enolpyruvyl-6-hydroxy-3-cyclohexene-1-carboxylate synthase
VNPSTALGTVLVDELIRCGLREAVLAPGSRSTPLAMALWDRAAAGGLRLHVRIDERSAAYLALGLAKASRRPVAVLCTSGTAAASFHPAVIEADESAVPLLVLTADRPPELRGTGANQAIDQVKLYGTAVRWFCDAGVPEARTGMQAYWRSLACGAWAHAAGAAGGLAGPVHLNLPLRDPLVPGAEAAGGAWPEPLDGRAGGRPWTALAGAPAARPVTGAPAGAAGGPPALDGAPGWPAGVLELPWTERGAVVCGDGDYDAGPLLRLAEQAGWPVLAEPSSGARRGPNALRGYPYLLAWGEFAAAHRPDVIVSAGRPGLSRGQLAFLRNPGGRPPARHVVIAQGPGRWADPARTATDVVSGVRLAGRARCGSWLESWQRADAAASRAADEILDASALSEPRLARDLAAALPDGALLWAASSLPIRDLDRHMAPRDGLRVMASRGASGIDGLISSAMGAALAHAAAGGGPAFALLGDLAFLHDAASLVLGPDETRPDLCLVVVNNDGGGIFSTLEQAAFEAPFERVFGTPHGAGLDHYARAAGLPHLLLEQATDLPGALRTAAGGLRIIEARTDRAGQAALRARLAQACTAAVQA